jgi:myotubularin-related protein 1/2
LNVDGILDSELKEVAAFRSKSRIPILGWRNKATGVSLTRCSQPKTGMRNTRCKEDEKLISLIQRSNPCSRKLHIMDARPMTNAFANMALGGGNKSDPTVALLTLILGYENLNFYPDCELEFMGIGNIHVVRDSWNKLRDLCEVHCTSTDNTGKFCNYL